MITKGKIEEIADTLEERFDQIKNGNKELIEEDKNRYNVKTTIEVIRAIRKELNEIYDLADSKEVIE